MKLPQHNSEQAFTMVEIAICLAVIGFALVAIIGVLPSGMQVQRDNKEETLINQDGIYFMEAIRSGASNLDDLVNYVTNITVVEFDANDTNEPPAAAGFATNICKFNSGTRIIGSLSTPYGSASISDCITPNPNRRVLRVEAAVRSISGSAIEKGPPLDPANPTVSFEYLLQSQVLPVGPFDPSITNAAWTNNMQRNLHEVRLTFRWPLQTDGKAGNNKKVFRTMISGLLTNNADGYFFTPGIYRDAALP